MNRKWSKKKKKKKRRKREKENEKKRKNEWKKTKFNTSALFEYSRSA